jgi:cyclophilin family peptidyl-prolyl cis-trans isomerase/HEAT repeat protein
MHIKIFLSLVIILFIGKGCIPPSQQTVLSTDVSINFKDANVQKLLNFQDRLMTDSLIPYFKSNDATYRYLAALAMGSVKDPKALMGLEQLLNDPSDDVKTMAAYAIGQIGDSTATSALVKAFKVSDTLRQHQKYNATILEAVGKIAPAKYLKYIATTNTYRTIDTVLLEGQAYAIYRFMQRGITNTEASQKMTSTASDSKIPVSVRVIAANYLARSKDIQLDSAMATKISAIMSVDADYRIRMSLARALSKSTTTVSMYALINQLSRDSDYRVKIAAIDALGSFNYAVVAPVIRNYLYAKDLHLAQAAASFFINHGVTTEAHTDYWNLAKDTMLLPSVQLMMYEATNKHVSSFMQNTKGWVNAELFRKLSAANNTSDQVAAINALAEYGWNYRNLKEQGFQYQSPLVRTATVQALGNICKKPDFYRVFGSGATKVRIDMYSYMLEILQVGDPGMSAVAAEILRIPEMGFQYFYAKMLDKSFLVAAQNKLNLPKDIETWNEIQKTIDFLNGVPLATSRKIPDYNQPIDWKLLNSFSPLPNAHIQTKYGTIVIELFANKAPGTVVNFIQLVNNNFYNGKSFHRVVSNFVIQGGCPRGDGYGALDYTIRSELPPMHWDNEGYIGMASSGNHTEGTQFFINNAPTLHLDGNYTIFGKVKSGIDAVHKIQQGDLIEKVFLK